ncbi:MAG: serine hydrolase [Myxococcota bacterium]
MPTRRRFLGLGAGTVAAAAFAPRSALAAATDDSWDISYLWSQHLDRALDYREIVADALGPEVAAKLIVVHGLGDHWGVVFDRTDSDAAAARALADTQDRELRERLGGSEVLATALRDRGYERLFHVAYGMLPSEEEARVRYDRIVELLGPEVHADLVLEQADAHGWQVTWKRYATREQMEAAAAAQSAKLAPQQIPAQVVVDRYLDLRWGSTSGAVASAAPAVAPIKPASRNRPLPAAIQPSDIAAPPEAVVSAKPAPAPRAPGVADDIVEAELPSAVASPLRDSINAYIQTLRKQRVIAADERTSWYVHTLHDDKTWAAINGELSLQCASMFKPYVALAFMQRVSEKRLVYGKLSRSKLEAMIQRSDNGAANWAMETLGGPAAVQKILRASYGDVLRDTSIVELIPRDGRTYRNRSSARDYVAFSRALWRDEVAGADEIKRLMALPGRDRLMTGTRSIPSCTQVLNKTGTTSQLCGDFGILVAKDKHGKDVPYAIVGIIEKGRSAKSFGDWVSVRADVIRHVSGLAYDDLQSRYDLV